MADDNLAIWNALETTDRQFTKSVSRPGGFKGTAVDPVYNLKRVTQVLGPVGYAWGWHVLNERLDTFGSGEDAVTIHSLTVRAWFRQDDGTVLEVDQIGHTTVAQYRRARSAEEKRRFEVDEEYGKKSLTDALSKVMMSLGASSDIWMGRFDGNKYVPPENWPELNGNGHGKPNGKALPHPDENGNLPDEQPRQTRQPPKPQIVAGEHPEAAVERANARMDQRDPWKLDGTPTEHLLDTLKTAIAQKPWAEVEQLTPYYTERLKLTEHEKAETRKAWVARRKAETPITAVG